MVNVETVVVGVQSILRSKKMIIGFGKRYVILVIICWRGKFQDYHDLMKVLIMRKNRENETEQIRVETEEEIRNWMEI